MISTEIKTKTVIPGSLVIGWLLNKDWIVIITLLKLQILVHPGPDHVPNIDKQTFPSTYKFGLNRTLPSPVQNFTFGGE